ncbi:MAG: hypothetical protein HOE19_04255 [Candidatus Komeilibacteria bacterium]|jgi:cell fate regulator YaaT (PSP1 superfamily)|nr:hypothetical protein [Candidatus Komeilibacteria bacterium]MBT4447886.1 hypothetical protein [Candidatus Komeilibacteria bacterium]
MKVVKVQFHKLDKEYFFLPEFSDDAGAQVEVGDSVVVSTILGQDVGQVTDWADWEPSRDNKAEGSECSRGEKTNGDFVQDKVTDVKPMLRPLREEDLDKLRIQKKESLKIFTECKRLIDKHGLKTMKLVDMSESFDTKRMTFYFISSARVDFRELVKDLVKNYHKKIRLQQVGVRDAAKVTGDLGPCGIPLCCKSWLNTIGSVSPDSIKNQELSHRGADRLTGPCGRLKCCLRFEEEAYKYERNQLPKEGDIIKTGAGPAKVVAVHPMKHTVHLKIDDNIVEYPYLEGKLCEIKSEE